MSRCWPVQHQCESQILGRCDGALLWDELRTPFWARAHDHWSMCEAKGEPKPLIESGAQSQAGRNLRPTGGQHSMHSSPPPLESPGHRVVDLG